MNIVSNACLRNSFKTACIVAAICMVGYWFYKFDVEDRDIGTVDYMSFKDASGIKYPVASLCFEEPFSRGKISNSDIDVNITQYLEY